MINCEWCSHSFEPTSIHQIYCDAECRKLATKQKVKDRARIVAIKRRKKSGDRTCINDNCDTILSVYNDSRVCHKCSKNDRKVKSALSDMKGFIYEQDE